jgi:hypothetical protein
MDWEKLLEDLVNSRNSRKRSKTITAIRPSGSSSSVFSYDFTSLYPSQMQSYGRYDRRPIKRKLKIKKILNG